MAQQISGYKHDAPFDSGFLKVDAIHHIHFEQYGRKDGKPVIFVHGGPGGSTSLKNTIFFNPAIYRVILYDQRGCGQSLPMGELRDNTSAHLISDLEALREHFGIQQWHVFGGSWGSVLSLLYAQTHPEVVLSLKLRGVFFLAPEESNDSDAFFQRTRITHPEAYDELYGHLSPEERKDITGSYLKRITCGDRAVELAAVKAYSNWGGSMTKLIPDPPEREAATTPAEEDALLARTRIDCHYNVHGQWLKELRYLYPEKLERIKHIPCTIVNGRYDVLCPALAAWRLHKALPQSNLFMIPDAGHSAYEPDTLKKLVEVCDELAKMV
ncbi:hypothetical protein PRZ48_014691 [Zasmidium cellare]|uniref:Proline iminopeptidase n=1 Tax=Zasmidium cellare TaxID=395010 RepID=A0ABR0DZH7_ZASCE|nr:hypothetical protein PRZ48_014691 [Zasmidium cellare]